MKIHEDTYDKLLRDAGGIFGTQKWMPEAADRHRVREILRQDECKKVLRETGEHVDIIEARWPQKIGEREAGGRGDS